MIHHKIHFYWRHIYISYKVLLGFCMLWKPHSCHRNIATYIEHQRKDSHLLCSDQHSFWVSFYCLNFCSFQEGFFCHHLCSTQGSTSLMVALGLYHKKCNLIKDTVQFKKNTLSFTDICGYIMYIQPQCTYSIHFHFPHRHSFSIHHHISWYGRLGR